ncbi:MAG: hypothetical protein A2176_00375 [Spirochaetes bacterium RBG_13_51_14]|nr:MAG: hypothetical protein A2176_00375 [Spirochaetes bacterium RBG_13_51_14]
MWILSSSRHSTAGILAQDGSINGKELLDHLYRFVNDLYPSAKIISKYSAFIPSASDPSFYDQPCAGDNWILVGDAAGHTEPLLGEGIYYAMKSGQLAAQAITAGDIIGYDKLWRDCYGNILKESSINKQNLLVLTDKFGSEAYGAFLYYNIFMNQL